MNFPWGKTKVPHGQRQLPQEIITLLGGRLKFLKETYVLNFFKTITISFLFLYWLESYHWKGFEEGHNFAPESTSFRIHIK
jgi:hypothetical protein